MYRASFNVSSTCCDTVPGSRPLGLPCNSLTVKRLWNRHWPECPALLRSIAQTKTLNGDSVAALIEAVVAPRPAHVEQFCLQSDGQAPILRFLADALGACRVSINSFAARLFAACLGLFAGGLAWPPAAEAATTTFTSAWGGGTIATGNEALINNGASITGNVVANGQLTFNQTTNLTVGTLISGSGTVFLTNTGTVSLTGSTSYSAGTTVSRGTLVVTGSSGRVSQPFATMVLGTNAGDNGGLVITAGGSVSTGAAQVGYGAGSRGVATVGTGGSWNTPVGLVVGASGTGTLNVNGGMVTANTSYLGVNAGGAGTATVTDGTWATGGDMSVGSAGPATLTINGGLVSVARTLSRGASGTINLNAGGTLQIGTGGATGVLLGGTGSLVNNGTLVFNRSNAFTHSGTISGAGKVTKQGAGTLTLAGPITSDGGTSIRSGTLVVGVGAAITSAATGSANFISVGSTGGDSAALAVAGGSIVTQQTRVGVNVSEGIVAGSASISSGSWTNADSLIVGGYVTGTLDVSGGTVTAASSSIGIGSGGVGNATVTGGTWATTSSLSVGNTSGKGTLTLAGGEVSSGRAYVGYTGGSGTAEVSSGRWTTSGDLYVGYSGTGTLAVTGGEVTSGTAYVGYNGGSGTASVSGGTWTTSGDLLVGAGSRSRGTLAISGGVVTVGGTLSVSSSSTIILDPGGTLQIGTGLKNGVLLGGTGSLVNNGTLVFNRGLNYTYSGTISGSGAITKRVTGMLTLAGASSVSGPTTIEKGNVQLAHPAALSASTITPLAGGTMSLAPNLQTTVGGLVPNAGGLVDVGNGLVTVASGLSAATMVAALEAGRGPVGRWSGTTGITSGSAAASRGERTVGWLDNGNGSVAFAFAAEGDTNLDWQLDIIDAANFLAASKFDSGTPASWNQGDFTYDGIVDILDAAGFVATGLFDAGPYVQPAASAGLVAVPEPAGCGLAAIAAGVAILVRRRR